VIAETPVNLTGRQMNLLREFDESVQAGGKKHRPQSTWRKQLLQEDGFWEEALAAESTDFGWSVDIG
jgi:hypothetical protein